MGDDVFAGEEHGFEIDRHHPVPILLALLDHPAGRHDADIVVQNVDAAKLAQAGVDDGLHMI